MMQVVSAVRKRLNALSLHHIGVLNLDDVDHQRRMDIINGAVFGTGRTDEWRASCRQGCTVGALPGRAHPFSITALDS